MALLFQKIFADVSLYITPNMLCLVILFELIRKIDILNRHKILALVCLVAEEFSCFFFFYINFLLQFSLFNVHFYFLM